MILTLGHSIRPQEETVALLRANGVELLADVRALPRSRRNPQYNSDAFAAALAEAGIAYRHVPQLGGMRKPQPGSVNEGLADGFRGFADYMQTPEFASAIDELLASSQHGRTTVMCAEAVPWRCHRSMVADALIVRGIEVEDIYYDAKGHSRREPHNLTSFARVKGKRLWYPPEDNLFADLET